MKYVFIWCFSGFFFDFLWFLWLKTYWENPVSTNLPNLERPKNRLGDRLKQKKSNGKLETAERKIGRILGALGKFEKWH